MDHWVLTQIRLADRQGLLHGPRLSAIQEMAGAVLEGLAIIDRRKREDRELRLALLANGNYDPEVLFEELRPIETDDDAPLDDSTTEEGEPIAVTYDFSKADPGIDKAQIEREIAMMLARAASEGNATLADSLPEGEGWV